RSIGGIVRTEIEHVEKRWKNPTIVVAIRRTHHLLYLLTVGSPLRFVLGNEVAQSLLISNREDDLANRLVWVFECRISNPVEHARFACDTFEFVDVLSLDAAFSPFANAMHDFEQQRNQSICDFLGTLKHKGS